MTEGEVREYIYDLLTISQMAGFSDIKGRCYRRWCRFLAESKRNKLILAPRGTYKSSFFTIVYTIYRLLKDPYLRVIIYSGDESNAKTYLRTIRQFFREYKVNDKFIVSTHTAFDLALPNKKTKENTLTVASWKTTKTGQHYDLIILDDVVNKNDRESAATRKAKQIFFDDLLNLLHRDSDGKILSEMVVIGTRWHEDDLYNYILEQNKHVEEYDKYSTFIDTPYDKAGKTQYPSLTVTTLKMLEAKLDPVVFASQYFNNPLPEATRLFYEKNFYFFDNADIAGKDLEIVAYCDPSLGKGYESDFTSICVIGKDTDRTLYVLDWIVKRLKPSEIIDTIMLLYNTYQFERFGVECNGFQVTLLDLIEQKQRDEGIYFIVKEFRNMTNKQARIQGIEPRVRDGGIRFIRDYKQHDMYDLAMKQLLYFPSSKHDDAPDSLEGAVRLSLESYLTGFKGVINKGFA